MPSLEFFIVATTIAIDQRSNRVSILEVIEELEPVRFPAYLPRLAALTVWNLSPDDRDQDFQAHLSVTVPTLEKVGEFRQNFTGEGPTHRMLFQLRYRSFGQLPITTPTSPSFIWPVPVRE